MVEVIITRGSRHTGSSQGGGNPLLHIYSVQREVQGSGVSGTVYGSMKLAAGEQVWASEMKLNSIESLILTPEVPINNAHGYSAQQYIYQKGAYENYASIDIYNDAATYQSAGNGPTDGSIWISFLAHGEL